MITAFAAAQVAATKWESVLTAFEDALAGSDPTSLAGIVVPTTLGPVPPALEVRAGAVLQGMHRIERELADELVAVGRELDRIPTRPRFSPPPEPSQLDCSA